MIEQGIGDPRELEGGGTGLDRANQFVTVRTAGVRDLVKTLQALAGSAASEAVLSKAVMKAKRPLEQHYIGLANQHEATGNLARSVTHKKVKYPEGMTVVVGPRQTGPVGSTRDKASGNHAYLVEFGTGRRKPGSQGRRAYINVHQSINRRMTRRGSFNNTQFEQMGRGYYFLMGSLDERAGAGGRPGYSRDFSDSYGTREQHPIALKPGDTIAPMKPLGLMEKTINATDRQVFEILKATLEAGITAAGG